MSIKVLNLKYTLLWLSKWEQHPSKVIRPTLNNLSTELHKIKGRLLSHAIWKYFKNKKNDEYKNT